MSFADAPLRGGPGPGPGHPRLAHVHDVLQRIGAQAHPVGGVDSHVAYTTTWQYFCEPRQEILSQVSRGTKAGSVRRRYPIRASSAQSTRAAGFPRGISIPLRWSTVLVRQECSTWRPYCATMAPATFLRCRQIGVISVQWALALSLNFLDFHSPTLALSFRSTVSNLPCRPNIHAVKIQPIEFVEQLCRVRSVEHHKLLAGQWGPVSDGNVHVRPPVAPLQWSRSLGPGVEFEHLR